MTSPDEPQEFQERLEQIRAGISPSLRRLGCKKTSKNVWRLDSQGIVVRVSLDVSQASVGQLQVILEFSPTPAKPFTEHAWVLLSRISAREDLYVISSEGQAALLVRDFEEYATPLLTRWSNFEDLWRDILWGIFKDDPVLDMSDARAALSALEIAHYHEMGGAAINEALEYIDGKGWKFPPDGIQDGMASAFPQILGEPEGALKLTEDDFGAGSEKMRAEH